MQLLFFIDKIPRFLSAGTFDLRKTIKPESVVTLLILYYSVFSFF